jgi:hypothetical protein
LGREKRSEQLLIFLDAFSADRDTPQTMILLHITSQQKRKTSGK